MSDDEHEQEMARNREPYPSEHRKAYIESRLTYFASCRLVAEGWSVKDNADGTDWDISFTLSLPDRDEEVVTGDAGFRLLDTGRFLGAIESDLLAEERPGEVVGHRGHTHHSIRRAVGDAEEEYLHAAILGGQTLTAHLLHGHAVPHLQVSVDKLVLVWPGGESEVCEEYTERLVDVLNIRAEARTYAADLGLSFDEDDEAAEVEDWVFEKLAHFVAQGWILAWSNQPTNGAGAIVWWESEDPAVKLPTSPDGELLDSVEVMPKGVHGKVIGYEEVHTAVQYFEDGQRTAQRLAGRHDED
ncbi:hypothetical protein ACFVXC_05440 [Streptomyces sp. NPDC058257]|uniref:hypothetical protein n=1 Tax=Streptomyces sp. NPDC058257 TaxID=3346409 RepID=UPI0036EA1E29